jgi:hypothetical protein
MDTHTLLLVKADGYVIGSSIKHIPIAGSDITKFVQSLLRERGENIPPEDSWYVAQKIKEDYGYTCANIVKEFQKYDAEPGKYIEKFNALHSVTKQVSQYLRYILRYCRVRRLAEFFRDSFSAIHGRCWIRTIPWTRGLLQSRNLFFGFPDPAT